ncbi:MAG TPA: hypothetical protein VGN07_23185 [Steroidobacteraceae bacterium]
MKHATVLIALLPLCAFAAADGGSADSVAKSLKSAMERQLTENGTVCLGKFDWPIEVSEPDFQEHTRDAVQMPVLEQLGLVTASKGLVLRRTAATEESPATEEKLAVTRYALTEAGRRYYLAKNATTGTGASKVEHHYDLCPVRLSLDKVVRWDEPTAVGATPETTLTYTYKATSADWVKDPGVQKVFPVLDRLIKGAGTLQLQQRMRLTKEGWVALAPRT